MAAGGTFIRIPRVSPSIFSRPDDEHFVPACMDNFRAREGEDVSLWLLSDEPVERQRVLAAFAAARNKLQPLSFLELQQEWLDECQIQPRQIHDPAALDCVRRFHYEMREPDAETLSC